MSKPKYMKGDCIRSLDDLVLQENIYMKEGCPCNECCDSSSWEWRGLPEAPEEGEKA